MSDGGPASSPLGEGPASPWSVPDFRWLWIGRLAAVLGIQIQSSDIRSSCRWRCQAITAYSSQHFHFFFSLLQACLSPGGIIYDPGRKTNGIFHLDP